MASIPLLSGATYYAGANLPFYVSHGMVTNYLEGKGFRNVQWHDRDVPLPSTVAPPQGLADYSDDWDEWASAEYSGPSGALDPPASPAWVKVDLPAVKPAAQLPAVASSTPSASAPSQTVPARVAPAGAADKALTRQKRLGAAASVAGAIVLIVTAMRAITRKSENEVQRL